MNFYETYVSPRVYKYVKLALDSGFLNEGEVVDDFTKEFEDEFNIKNVIMVNSCTSALHLALVLSGVKLRQEVILSPQTFVATGLAIKFVGANPVFADIGRDGNIDPEDILKKITKRTKAILITCWGGNPCQMEKISNIAKQHNLKLICDAAHALWTIYRGKPISNYCDYTCFSFQSIKHLTTGDGGALVCSSDEDYQLGKRLKWFGISKEFDKVDILNERVYDLDKIGYKYQMNNVTAAIGLANLETIKQRIRYRRFLAKIYYQNLKVEKIHMEKDSKSSYWVYPILVDKRLEVISKLKENRIPYSVVHRGIDRNELFGGEDNTLKMQRYWDKHQLHLPIHEKMTPNDVLKVCEAVNSV